MTDTAKSHHSAGPIEARRSGIALGLRKTSFEIRRAPFPPRPVSNAARWQDLKNNRSNVTSIAS